MHMIDAQIATCIDLCLHGYLTCHGMVMTHGLETRGRPAEPAHIRDMMACAEICRRAAISC